MATVYTFSGTWLFHSSISWWGTQGVSDGVIEVNFRVNKMPCYKMSFVSNSIFYYTDDYGRIEAYSSSTGWADESYRIVDFGAPQQTTDTEDYNLLRFNAKQTDEYYAYYLIKNSTLTSIADAIRAKNGTLTPYTPPEMSSAILALEGGGIIPTGTLSIVENGTYDVTNYASTEVNVEGSGSNGIVPAGTINITENGVYDVTNYASAAVSVVGSSGSETTDLALQLISDRNSIVSVTVPDGVTKIEEYAFHNCTSLESIVLPNSITDIDNYAFGYCESLVLTSLPSSVVNIGNSAFRTCRALVLTSLPSSVVNIDNYAFFSCTGLTSITFEGTPTKISTSAFNNCTNLTTINVPWAEGAVANAPWGATNATINYNYTGE